MRRADVVLLLTFVLLCTAGESGRAQERAFSVSMHGNLTTTGHLFPDPKAVDPFARALSYDFSDLIGYGVEVQFHPPGSSISIGLSADYIHAMQSRTIVATAQRIVPVDDGYRIVPVELTGYFHIPVTDGAFGVFMGGGVGFYFGERQYSMAGVDAPAASTNPGYGIHVLGGVRYRLSERIQFSAEMKFRDAQIESTNAFPVPQVRYGDILVNLPQKPLVSSIHIDGMVFQLGAAFSL